LKNKRKFLKRSPCPTIMLKDLYIGSIVNVNARQLKIVDYGDTATRKRFARGKETQFALIKPDAYMHTGKIIDSIYASGFIISKMKMARFNNVTASRFVGGAPNA
jgi:nucleoside-diphosphate kinase